MIGGLLTMDRVISRSARLLPFCLSLLFAPLAAAFTVETKSDIVGEVRRAMPAELRTFLENYEDELADGLRRASPADPAALEPVAIFREIEKLTGGIREGLPAPVVAGGFGRLASLVAETSMPLATARWGRDLVIKEAFEEYIESQVFYVRMPPAEYLTAPLGHLEDLSDKAGQDDSFISIVYWWSNGQFPETMRTVSRRYVESAAAAVADVWLTVFDNAGRDLSSLPAFAPEPSPLAAQMAEGSFFTEALSEALSLPLSLSSDGALLEEVIREVAEKGGIQIVPQVELPAETVTVDLVEVPLIRALNIVLDRFGLYARAETEAVVVIEPAATYDTVVLRSGYTVTGRLTEYSGGKFRFQVDVGEIAINQSFIERIDLSRSVGSYAPMPLEAVGAGAVEVPVAGAEEAVGEEGAGEVAGEEAEEGAVEEPEAPVEEPAEGAEPAPAVEGEVVEERSADFDDWIRAHPKWRSDDAQAVSWSEAEGMVGSLVLAEGRIVSTYRDEGRSVVMLNFHDDMARHLKIVIFGSDLANFPSRPEVYYKDREVRVLGVVEDLGAGPEIVVGSPDKIEIARY